MTPASSYSPVSVRASGFPSTLLAALLFLLLPSLALNAATYWVTTGGSNSNDGTSQSSGWATLQYACTQVAANQGHTIRMGPGTFTDPVRLTGNGNKAILPQGVNLVGSGKTQTTYKGEIYVPTPGNQNISDFHMDGRENTTAAAVKFQGLIIQDTSNIQRSNVHVFNMRIEGFYGMGLQFGYWSGLKNSSLHDCDLVNNGKHNSRGFGMRTGNMVDTDIYNNTFLEERGKGGEPWNSGERTFTNVKVYNNTFKIHSSSAGGWNGQVPFNFEWFHVDCLNVEIYGNKFDGSVSLVDKVSHRSNRQPFSVRVYDNVWEFPTRYCIEVSMNDMVIDHNYFHFGSTLDPEDGGADYALAAFGYTTNNVTIHHNVFDGFKTNGIHRLSGDNIGIYNNTILGSRPGEAPGSATPVFIKAGDIRTNWDIVNNVFRCDPARQGKFIDQDATGYTMPGLRMLNNAIYLAESGLNSTILAQSNVDAPAVLDPDFVEYGARPEPYFALLPGSPLIDAGAIVSGITDGYEGSAPDIGAYEGATSQNAPLLPLGTELVVNGGFEDPQADISFGFNQNEGVIGWTNAGTASNSVLSRSTNPAEGSRHASIYFGGFNTRSIAQLTDHVIRTGDVYTLNFKHNITGAWNPKLGARLYYEVNGQRIEFYSWSNTYNWYGNRGSNNDPSTQPWQTETITGITVPAAAVGRPIGVWFTNTIASQSVYVDDVSLERTAGPVPAPATPVVVATEGFESNSWTGGTGWSNAAWVRSGISYVTQAARFGTYTAQIKGTASNIVRDVNLSGYANVEIDVSVRNYLCESTDQSYVDFFDGQNWTTVLTVTGEKPWTDYTIDLSGFTMTGNVQKIRFRSGLDSNTDFAYMDGIEIRGTN